jgi:hypothetical protein
MMIPYQLSAVITQAYFQDGDEAVREILVFVGNEAFNKFDNTEKRMGDPQLATFRVRSVKTGEGNYMGIVRLGSGEMIMETTYRDKSQNSMLYNMLNRLLPGWELKEIYSDKVPSRNPFDGKF